MKLVDRIRNGKLFQKRTGEDKTRRCFASYVKNQIIFVVLSIIIYFMMDPGVSMMYILVIMFFSVVFAVYGLLSLRLRKVEERLEANRI